MSNLFSTAKSNLKFAVLAQLFSMLMSVFITLMLPKVLNKEGYGMWQLFMLYSSYAGIFHLGLNDGIYLKIGGADYSELDYQSIGAQFRIGILYETILAVAVCGIMMCFERSPERRFIALEFMLYIVIMNAVNFIGFVFQAVNQTRIYSISVMLDKIVFLCISIVLIVSGIKDHQVYTLLYVCSWIVSLSYVIWKGRRFIFIKIPNLYHYLSTAIKNIIIGSKLLVSNLAGLTILGIGRFIVDGRWDIETFAELSLALTMMNFFINFIKQTSIIFFPMLRKVSTSFQNQVYEVLETLLRMILPAILVVYLPLRHVMLLWLPQYEPSFDYLAVLLPICIYEGQVQLLSNTYLKVLRSEDIMLQTNVIAMIISAVLCLFSACVFHSIDALVFSMAFAIHIRSLLIDSYLAKVMNISKSYKLMFQEILITMLYCVSALKLNYYLLAVMSIIVYATYITTNRTQFKTACKNAIMLKQELS